MIDTIESAERQAFAVELPELEAYRSFLEGAANLRRLDLLSDSDGGKLNEIAFRVRNKLSKRLNRKILA